MATEEITGCHELNTAKTKTGRGRLYIPHGRGVESEYKPHTGHIDVSYTQCGPDWSSSLRRISSPKPKAGQPKETMFHPPMKSIRHFPCQNNTVSKKEYSFYRPHGIPLVFGKGKQTTFGGTHKGSQLSSREFTNSVLFGKHANVPDPRNGIKASSAGDKPYQAVEYSIDFHKLGSTRPVVDFGGTSQHCAINVPVTVNDRSNRTISKPFSVKIVEQRKSEEINTVRELESWRAASPLLVPCTDSKA